MANPLIGKIRSFLFENKTVRQTVAKNTVWQGIGTVISRLIKAVLIIYVARILGTEGYGIFSYTVGLAAFFSIFSDIGIGGILTREGARNPNTIPIYFSTSLVIKIVLVALSIALIIGVAPFFTKIPEAVTLLPLAALLIMFDGFRDFVFSITKAKERMEVEAGFQTLTNISITVFGLIAVILQPTPEYLLVGYILGSATGTVGAVWYLRKYFYKFWRTFQKSLVITILKEAWPFSIVIGLGMIMANTDTIMLGWFKDAHAIGLYAAAFRPIQLLYFLPGLLASSVFPVFSRFAKTEPKRFKTILETSIAATFLISLPALAGGLVLSKEIIGFVFGPEYIGASLAFNILLFTVIANFPSSLLINGLFAHGRQKVFAGTLAVGALGNVILNFIFIPILGIAGSAIATLFAQILSYGLMWYFMWRMNKFSVAPFLPRAILSAIIMGIFVWAINLAGIHVLLSIAFGAILYFGLLFLLKDPLLENIKPKNLLPNS